VRPLIFVNKKLRDRKFHRKVWLLYYYRVTEWAHLHLSPFLLIIPRIVPTVCVTGLFSITVYLRPDDIRCWHLPARCWTNLRLAYYLGWRRRAWKQQNASNVYTPCLQQDSCKITPTQTFFRTVYVFILFWLDAVGWVRPRASGAWCIKNSKSYLGKLWKT